MHRFLLKFLPLLSPIMKRQSTYYCPKKRASATGPATELCGVIEIRVLEGVAASEGWEVGGATDGEIVAGRGGGRGGGFRVSSFRGWGRLPWPAIIEGGQGW